MPSSSSQWSLTAPVAATLLSLLLAPHAGLAQSTAGAPRGYWQQERVESRKADLPPHPCYTHTSSGGQGAATVTSEFTCGNKPWTGTVSGAWSSPPSILVPGQTIQFSVAGRASATHSGLGAGGTIDGRFDTQRCGNARNVTRIVELSVAAHVPQSQAGEKTGTAVVPGLGWNTGVKELDGRLLLKVCMPGWQAYFWYAWKPGPPPATSAATFTRASIPPAPAPAPPEPAAENPREEDSGVRFSDLSGQVEWRRHDAEEEWQLARFGDVLPVDAHIRTAEESGAILSFADMTTFVMKPESEIVLSSPKSQESELKLLIGNLLVNVRKMMKDGSMEVEMSQAVAGIKGTILSASEKPGVSEVAVCEGRVTFTHQRTRQALDLGPGEKGVATANGLRRIQVGAKAVCDEYASALRLDSSTAGAAQPYPAPTPPAAPAPPAPPATEVLGTYAIVANGYRGTLELSGGPGGYTGRIRFEYTSGRWEDLIEVSYSAAARNLSFTRPRPGGLEGYAQRYTGQLDGKRVAGTFSQQGSSATYPWQATRD